MQRVIIVFTLLFVIVLVSCGPPGSQGPPGTPGTQVSTVKFCNSPTTYPTSFPEYGFCIDNVLYATFWDGHNAWTAQIPPGNYLSTSTGLQCNFNVTTGCIVVH